MINDDFPITKFVLSYDEFFKKSDDASAFVPIFVLGDDEFFREKMQRGIKKMKEDRTLKDTHYYLNYYDADSAEDDLYVKRGPEINEGIRKNIYNKEYIKQIRDNLKTFNDYRELRHLDYIIVCRAAFREYDSDINNGFISTSNVTLKGFGNYVHAIIIPKDVKIRIVDITEMVNSGGGRKKVYEIYTDLGEKLHEFFPYDEKMGNRGVFGIESRYLFSNLRKFKEIAKVINESSDVCL